MLALIDKSPTITEAYDTSTTEFSDYLDEVATWFENQHKDYATIDAQARAGKHADSTLGFRVALRIAESRRILRNIDEPVTITLINPVYKEITRMQTRADHPHGENSIVFKMSALQQLELLNPALSCRFYGIDDSSPGLG